MTGVFHRHIVAQSMAVRTLLAEMRAELQTAGLHPDRCGTVEIALAEALNNIVEHAYAGTPGEITFDMALGAQGLRIDLRDNGAPLPGPGIPINDPPVSQGHRDTLPEGGFGWFLIRTLTRDLHYQRTAQENHLTLCFDV